jgi:hypothetical protein
VVVSPAAEGEGIGGVWEVREAKGRFVGEGPKGGVEVFGLGWLLGRTFRGEGGKAYVYLKAVPVGYGVAESAADTGPV